MLDRKELTLLEQLKSLYPFIPKPNPNAITTKSNKSVRNIKKNIVSKTDIKRSNNKYAKGSELPGHIKGK